MERLSNFLPEQIKRDLKTKLTQWQDNGIKLFGNRIDPNLLKTIFDEFQKTLKNVEKYSIKQKQPSTYLNSAQNVTLPGSSQRTYRRIGNLNGTPVPRESRLQPSFNSTSGSQGEQSSFSNHNR